MSKVKKTGDDKPRAQPALSAEGAARKRTREARSAEALRANLRRRKEAQSGHALAEMTGDEPPG